MKRLLLPLLFIFFATFTLAQTVYVTKTGKKYHTASCSYLKSSIEKTLNDAVGQGYSACSRCKPPTLSSSTMKTNSSNTGQSDVTTKPDKTQIKEQPKTKTKSTVSSGRCQATTKKGTQCKRNAQAGSNYCWQH